MYVVLVASAAFHVVHAPNDPFHAAIARHVVELATPELSVACHPAATFVVSWNGPTGAVTLTAGEGRRREPRGSTARIRCSSPSVLAACTVKWYVVPFVNPVTTSSDAEPVAVCRPGDAVAVYELIGAPMVVAPENATDAWWLPPVPETVVGAGRAVADLDVHRAEVRVVAVHVVDLVAEAVHAAEVRRGRVGERAVAGAGIVDAAALRGR